MVGLSCVSWIAPNCGISIEVQSALTPFSKMTHHHTLTTHTRTHTTTTNQHHQITNFHLSDIDACTNNPCTSNADCIDLPPPALDDQEGRTFICQPGYANYVVGAQVLFRHIGNQWVSGIYPRHMTSWHRFHACFFCYLDMPRQA